MKKSSTRPIPINGFPYSWQIQMFKMQLYTAWCLKVTATLCTFVIYIDLSVVDTFRAVTPKVIGIQG